VKRVLDDRTDDGRRHLTNVFCGVWQKQLVAAIKLAPLCNTAVNSAVKSLVFANFLAPTMTPVYAAVATRVGQALGMPAELVEGRDFDQLRDGSVDLAFLCGLPYVRLSQERPGTLHPLVAPVLDEPRYEDRPVYFSDVIVRADSAATSFGDLRGWSWAYNDPDSLSGCLLVRYHLLQMGESEAFFGRVTFSGRHQESIRQVVSGEVDASAIDSHVLGVACFHNPDLARQFRVIAVLGPSTIPPVVATGSVPQEMRVLAGDAICALSGDAAGRDTLARGLIRRFTPIEDPAYDDIREKLAIVESAATGG
jgi:phosphonate transport system substrate-binding protein